MVITTNLTTIVGFCVFEAQIKVSLFQISLPEAALKICFCTCSHSRVSLTSGCWCALLNLFSHSDWLARPLSLQMFTDWIMELSLLLWSQSIAFPTHRSFVKHATTLVITRMDDTERVCVCVCDCIFFRICRSANRAMRRGYSIDYCQLQNIFHNSSVVFAINSRKR